MGLTILKSRSSDDYREYKKAVKMAKQAIETICELTEDMEEEFGERDYGERGYGERSQSRVYDMRRSNPYRERDDWDSMDERRSRDSRGRYM